MPPKVHQVYEKYYVRKNVFLQIDKKQFYETKNAKMYTLGGKITLNVRSVEEKNKNTLNFIRILIFVKLT